MKIATTLASAAIAVTLATGILCASIEEAGAGPLARPPVAASKPASASAKPQRPRQLQRIDSRSSVRTNASKASANTSMKSGRAASNRKATDVPGGNRKWDVPATGTRLSPAADLRNAVRSAELKPRDGQYVGSTPFRDLPMLRQAAVRRAAGQQPQ
jgi:hypothetical protein